MDADYRIGDASDEFVEIPDAVCVCGLAIAPVLGKLVEGVNMDFTVWTKGNYEHVSEPEFPHVAMDRETYVPAVGDAFKWVDGEMVPNGYCRSAA